MTFQHRHLVLAVVLVAIRFAAAEVCAAAPNNRFFLMGSGALHLENLRNNQQARIELLDANGAINETALKTVDRVFGFPSREKGRHISPRLLFMLSYFSDLAAPGKIIHIESAYRSPEYNEQLRRRGANAARTSTHIDGMALDFWIDGVDGKELWETVRKKHCCGVGHYGGRIIHLDAGRPRFWEAATSGTKSTEPDHNRHLYLTTGFDRYKVGEEMILSLSGLSNLDFGIRPTAKLYEVAGESKPVATIGIRASVQTECLTIVDPQVNPFISTFLPITLPSGRYQVQLEFCQRPFPQMPDKTLSNVIEVSR